MRLTDAELKIIINDDEGSEGLCADGHVGVARDMERMAEELLSLRYAVRRYMPLVGIHSSAERPVRQELLRLVAGGKG